MKNYLHKLFSLLILMAFSVGLSAQCADNIIANGSFESGAFTDWWNWHDNSPDAYTFASSDDAVDGDSSAVVNIVDIGAITGGQGGEYNSRPQTNPVIGGQWYEISFWAKSTEENTAIPFYIKDENDGWILLHQDLGSVGTDWTQVTSLWQADADRADIHIELKVFNGDFTEPYSVWFDNVTICPTEVLTNTCQDNIVANPGFEDGADVDWWTWHGGEETDYEFSSSTEGAVGNGSAKISVLKPASELTGPGEYNSRPQVSPLVADQNYKVTVMGKSTLDNTIVQLWVKDEFDGWSTVGNCDLTFGTDWSEQSFVFAADADRDDIHLEIKVFNVDFTEPYEVWFDEVSVCPTNDDVSCNEPDEPGPGPVFGATTGSDCNSNLAPGYDGFEDPMNEGWALWDGSDDEELATFMVDAVNPHTGSNAMRIDVTENHNVAEFHHRFGQQMTLEDGEEYTVTLWLRTDVEEGDTVTILARGVRDTDWTAQFARDLMVAGNDWLNYDLTFTADGTWDNAFLEFKNYRLNDAFTYPYSIWYDDVEICKSSDGTTEVKDLADLGLTFSLAPNPVYASMPLNLNIASLDRFEGAQISMVDVLGRHLWSQDMDITLGTHTVSIPTDGLQSGIYLVQIRHEGYVETLKVQVVE